MAIPFQNCLENSLSKGAARVRIRHNPLSMGPSTLIRSTAHDKQTNPRFDARLVRFALVVAAAPGVVAARIDRAGPAVKLGCCQTGSIARDYVWVWLVATIYWLVTLQGLRHAHPAMYACWVALAAYLAVYYSLFVWAARRILQRRIVPAPFMLIAVAPAAWVAIECLRNYLLTGISAAMLGHTMADVPLMIQTADLWGTYGLSASIVCVNVAIVVSWQLYHHEVDRKSTVATIGFVLMLLVGMISYGVFRLSQPLGESLATFALLQRDEEVVYEQSSDREVEMFRSYAQANRSSPSPLRNVRLILLFGPSRCFRRGRRG